MLFDFDTYNDDSKFTPNFLTIGGDFQDLIDKTLENRLVYVNIDYSSYGGDLMVLLALYNRIKQLNLLNVQVNINVVGDLASCGLFLILMLAKEKLCTFTFNPLFTPVYLAHEGYMRAYTNSLKDSDSYHYQANNNLKSMNKQLLNLLQEFVSLNKTEIGKFKRGKDIFLEHKDIYKALEDRGLIQKEFPIKADVIEFPQENIEEKDKE
nr:MAG TPA: hypothetical protein [Ackermannviridae sp.]